MLVSLNTLSENAAARRASYDDRGFVIVLRGWYSIHVGNLFYEGESRRRNLNGLPIQYVDGKYSECTNTQYRCELNYRQTFNWGLQKLDK